MTTATPEDQQALLAVQAQDTRAAQLAHQRRTLPVLARLEELGTQVADLESALITSRTALGDLRRELAKAEQDVEQVRTRAARDQGRLDSGGVSAKDAQALTSELQALARRQAELEEVELEVMERLEAHESAVGELTTAHEALLATRAEAEAERDAELARIDAAAAEVAEQRAAAAAQVDGSLLALYEKVRAGASGVGAALLRAGRCDGCRMELSGSELAVIRAATPQTVVRCEECGRILVRTAESGL